MKKHEPVKTKRVYEVIDEYVHSRAFKLLADSSKRQYSQALGAFEAKFYKHEINDIKRSDIISFLEEMKDTPAMSNRMARVISVLYSFSIDRDYVSGNPASRLKKQKIGSWVKWHPEEVGAVIALKDRVVSTAVALGWYTGQRESDILAMRWSDITKGHIRLRQKKTGHVMLIKVHPDLAHYLGSIDRAGPYIVSGEKSMSPAAFRSKFKARIADAGIEKNFHGIRKGVGAFLAESGASANEIAAMLGHSSLAMATLYTRQADETKLISSAVDSMPELVY